MQALQKTAAGPGHVTLVDVPEPEIGPHDILMKVYAAGICGSDLLIQEDRHFYRAPVTLGHEFSGVAYAVGSAVTRVREGQKLVADIECAPGEWLGVTVDGAYAPWMRLPEHVAYPVADHVSLEHAGLAEPIVATHHLIQERAQVRVGDDVVVVARGPWGSWRCSTPRSVVRGGCSSSACVTTSAAWPSAPGSALTTSCTRKSIRGGRHGPHRRQGRRVRPGVLGERAGRAARHRLRPQGVRGPGRQGRHRVHQPVGHKLTLDLDQVSLGQLDIRGSWSWNGRETWEHAVDLLNRGVFDLDPMITNHYALGEWEQAFANLRAKQDVKAYIHPHGRDWEPG